MNFTFGFDPKSEFRAVRIILLLPIQCFQNALMLFERNGFCFGQITIRFDHPRLVRLQMKWTEWIKSDNLIELINVCEMREKNTWNIWKQWKIAEKLRCIAQNRRQSEMSRLRIDTEKVFVTVRIAHVCTNTFFCEAENTECRVETESRQSSLCKYVIKTLLQPNSHGIINGAARALSRLSPSKKPPSHSIRWIFNSSNQKIRRIVCLPRLYRQQVWICIWSVHN